MGLRKLTVAGQRDDQQKGELGLHSRLVFNVLRKREDDLERSVRPRWKQGSEAVERCLRGN